MNWINVKEKQPTHHNDVLVTDQKEVWLGDYNANRRGCKWATVWNGTSPVEGENITHWMEKPHPIKAYK